VTAGIGVEVGVEVGVEGGVGVAEAGRAAVCELSDDELPVSLVGVELLVERGTGLG
jgi:hypothetical protein